MSIYNALFSENEDATALLGMIGCTRNEFMRYRDVYLNVTGDIITVVSRIGGKSYRKEYKQFFKNIARNPNYLKNYDDPFDETYCYFDFKVPEKYAHTCKMIAPKEKQLTVGEMFKKEIKESKIPGSPAEKRMTAIAETIFGDLKSLDDEDDQHDGPTIRIIRL